MILQELSSRKSAPLFKLDDSIREQYLKRIFYGIDHTLSLKSLWTLLSTTKNQTLIDHFAPLFFRSLINIYFSPPAIVEEAKNRLFMIDSVWRDLKSELMQQECTINTPCPIPPSKNNIHQTFSLNGLLQTIQKEWITSFDITPEAKKILTRPLKSPLPTVTDTLETLEITFDVEEQRSYLYHLLEACFQYCPKDPFTEILKNSFARSLMRQLIAKDFFVSYDVLSNHLLKSILTVKIPLLSYSMLESQGYFSLFRLLNEKCGTTGLTLSNLLHQSQLLYVGSVQTPFPEGGEIISQVAIRQTINLLLKQNILYQTMRANAMFFQYIHIYNHDDKKAMSDTIYRLYEEQILTEYLDSDQCRMHLERYPAQLHKAAPLCDQAPHAFKVNLIEHARSAYASLFNTRILERDEISLEMLKRDANCLLHLRKAALELNRPEALDTLCSLWSIHTIKHFKKFQKIPFTTLPFSGSILLMLNQFNSFFEQNPLIGSQLWVISRALVLLKAQSSIGESKKNLLSSFRVHSKMTEDLAPILKMRIDQIVSILQKDCLFLKTVCSPEELKEFQLQSLATLFSPEEIERKDPTYQKALKDLSS